MKILVTGAAGFLGRRISQRLVADGHEVVAFDARIAPDLVGACWVIGDITTGAEFEKIPWAELDVIYHLAASGVKASSRTWLGGLMVNALGTQLLLNQISRCAHKAPTVVLTRTFYEQALGCHPELLENSYIATKFAAYRLAEDWARTYLGAVVFASLFQVFGGDDDPANVLTYAMSQFIANEVAKFGDGGIKRDWIYVDDAVEAIIAASKNTGSRVERFDIGTGVLSSLSEVLALMARICDRDMTLAQFDPQKARGDAALMVPATRLPIDWTPKATLAERLSDMKKALESGLSRNPPKGVR